MSSEKSMLSYSRYVMAWPLRHLVRALMLIKEGFFDPDSSRSGFWTKQPTKCDAGMFERVAKEVDAHLQEAEAWNRVTDQSDPVALKQCKCFENQHHPLLVGLGFRTADQGVVPPPRKKRTRSFKLAKTGDTGH